MRMGSLASPSARRCTACSPSTRDGDPSNSVPDLRRQPGLRASGQDKKRLWTVQEIHRRTGTPVHPMSPLTKLLWFKEEDPETYDAAARWVSVKEYVLSRLFGEYVVDHSIASATGPLQPPGTRLGRRGAQDLLDLPREKLSRPVPTTHVMKGMDEDYAERLGSGPRETPFVVGANDGVLANLGLGATVPGVVACSIGTSGAVRSVVNEPQVDDDRTLFCYALTEEIVGYRRVRSTTAAWPCNGPWTRYFLV